MWNEERVEMLKKLWSDGLSATQIANELGGVTRNGVIGKVHRLNLSGRAKAAGMGTPRPRRIGQLAPRSHKRVEDKKNLAVKLLANPHAAPSKALTVVPPTQPTLLPPLEQLVIPASLRATVLSLTEQMCRWPIGDPASEDFNFCGHKRQTGTPYCEYHFRVAYQPVNDRRRARRIARGFGESTIYVADPR